MSETPEMQPTSPSGSVVVVDQAAQRLVSSAVQPLIAGFHADPSICRVGDEYFLAHSSFEYSPAVPLWRSTNLLDWEPAGHALPRADQFEPGLAQPSRGIFAPTLRHHDDRFWLITTNVSGPAGQLLVTAPTIEGPWSEPISIPEAVGIDPDLSWDEAGQCFLTWCSNDPEVDGIAQLRLDPRTGEALEPPRSIFAGTGMSWPEGPHLYQIGQWWYLLIAEGGTERGHSITVARGTSPEGPFEVAPHNPIFTRRSTTFPVQNTGHGDLVERPDGSWAMVYLGVRPRGGSPLFHVNGRETFLAGVDWVDGWPRVLPDTFMVASPEPGFEDDFTGGRLAERWSSPGAQLSGFTTLHRGGGVWLRPLAAANGAPALLATALTELRWRFTAEVSGTASAGLRIRLDEQHYYELVLEGGQARVEARIGFLAGTVGSQVEIAEGKVCLEASALPGTFGGPDDIAFAVVDGAGTRQLARLDGRYLSTEVAGGFTGRYIGVRATKTDLMLDRVRYVTFPEHCGTS